MVLLEEFEALTGFYPSSDLYAEIEKQYSDFDGDKQAFCRAFKKNKNFMASAAQTAANRRKWELASELEGERLKHQAKSSGNGRQQQDPGRTDPGGDSSSP